VRKELRKKAKEELTEYTKNKKSEDIFDEVDLYNYTVTVKKNTELPDSFIVKIENNEEQFYLSFTEEYDKQNNTILLLLDWCIL